MGLGLQLQMRVPTCSTKLYGDNQGITGEKSMDGNYMSAKSAMGNIHYDSYAYVKYFKYFNTLNI